MYIAGFGSVRVIIEAGTFSKGDYIHLISPVVTAEESCLIFRYACSLTDVDALQGDTALTLNIHQVFKNETRKLVYKITSYNTHTEWKAPLAAGTYSVVFDISFPSITILKGFSTISLYSVQQVAAACENLSELLQNYNLLSNCYMLRKIRIESCSISAIHQSITLIFFPLIYEFLIIHII